MKNITLSVVLIFFFLSFYADNLIAQFSLDIETGYVSTGINDVRIPGDTGTLFSLSSDLNPENPLYFRIRPNYTLNQKHSFSLLYAPLTVRSSGQFDQEIQFDDTIFPADTNIDATYTFNSYRFTYRYELVRKKSLTFGLGLTGKIRDAEIKLESDELKAANDNLGFVPLINFRLHYLIWDDLGLLVSGDALAAPQGRAEDILIALTYRFADRITAKLGYRILEGGADNDTVYTFALFHYASLGLVYTF